MRKKSILLIVLIFGSLFCTAIPSRAQYHGSPGWIYHYDFLINRVDLKLGGTSYSGNGINIAGHQLSIPQNYATLEIVSASPSYITSELTVGSYSEYVYSEWMGEDQPRIISLVIYPIHKSNPFLLNPSLVANGLDLIFYPFVDTTETFDLFDEFIAGTQSQLTMYMGIVNNAQYKSAGGLTGNLYSFDSYLSGDITQTGPPSYEFSFKLQFKCIYTYDLGVLQGMHYKVRLSGTYNGEACTITCEALVEIYGYDLPGFLLGGFDIAEDWWIIATAGGGALVLITVSVVIAVRSKKKPKKKSSKKKKKK